MIMLDILTIVHGFADIQTASRIRRTCRRLAVLIPQPTLYRIPQPTLCSNPDSTYEYRVDGKLHKLDGPAVLCKYGYKHWYRGGIRHREYHPQCIPQCTESYTEYIVEGEYHREAGPSIVSEYSEEWYLRDKRHRKTGPAITGERRWVSLGKYHRLDGPAYAKIYAIRGVAHRISDAMYGAWIVDDKIIRK